MANNLITVSNAGNLVLMGTLIPIITIITCWLLALALGHVPLWPWPMISDCGTQAPEKYLFRVGLVGSATLMARMSVLVRDFITIQARAIEGHVANGITPEQISVPIAQAASLCLALLSCISEDENGRVHGIVSVLFFVFYLIYQVVVSWRIGSLGVGGDFSRGAFTLKRLIASLCIADFILFIYFNVARTPMYTQAITEWTGVMLILLFNGTFYFDFRSKMFLADGYRSQGRTRAAIRLDAVVPAIVIAAPNAAYDRLGMYA